MFEVLFSQALPFAIAVLSSVIFWVVYFILSLGATVLILRRNAKRTYEWIIDGDKDYGFDMFESVLVLIFFFLFWLPVSITWILWHVIRLLSLGFGKLFRLALIATDKVIPDVDVKISKN